MVRNISYGKHQRWCLATLRQKSIFKKDTNRYQIGYLCMFEKTLCIVFSILQHTVLLTAYSELTTYVIHRRSFRPYFLISDAYTRATYSAQPLCLFLSSTSDGLKQAHWHTWYTTKISNSNCIYGIAECHVKIDDWALVPYPRQLMEQLVFKNYCFNPLIIT